MKKESRKALLDRLEEELDRQINIVVDQFQNMNQDELNRQGEEGGWSIAQNLQHLNLYFEYYNPAIKNALGLAAKDLNAETFKSGWLGIYFTGSMDYRKGNKIKAFKDYIPNPGLDADDVIRRFIDHEEEMIGLLRKAKDYNLTKIRIPISLTKWVTMRLGDVFQFVIMHNERHLVQAQFRLKAPLLVN